jgi:hypothetical protein
MNVTENQTLNASPDHPAATPGAGDSVHFQSQADPGVPAGGSSQASYSHPGQPLPPHVQGPVYPVDPRRKSPALAGMLSAMPGLGQIYVGYYPRGFLNAIVTGSLITLLASDILFEVTPLAAIFLAFFWLYNIIDALRLATLYNHALTGDQAPDMPTNFKMPGLGGSMFGGGALIVLGGVLLTHTLFDASLTWVKEWWPVVPIIFGVYLLGKAIYERMEPSTEAADRPGNDS